MSIDSETKCEPFPLFHDSRMHGVLESMGEKNFNLLPFGVIKMSRSGIVVGYNSHESENAGILPSMVIGHHCFTVVAPCTNNFMIALRFEDEEEIDLFLDYVFTLRMRPAPVELRLLKSGKFQHMFMLVRRK